jgi:cell division protein DivIC
VRELKEQSNKKRRKTRTNRQRLGNRMAILGITVVVFCLGVVVNIKSSSMKKKDLEYQIREEALMDQVQKEKDRAVELEEYRIHVQNKQYIEEIAKQKLGLVNPDEILLKPSQK